MQRLLASALLVSLAVVPCAAEPPVAKKLTPDEATKKFFQYWLEVEQVGPKGSTKDPEHLSGFQFAKDGCWQWGRRGELTAGLMAPIVHFDPTTTPMRLTLESKTREVPDRGRRQVKTAIVRFEGDKLHVAFGPWEWADPPAAGKDYPNRPTDFKTGYSVLVPSAYFGTD